MTLNLDDHLLQTPDGLLTALFRHLLRQIALGLIHSLTTLLLMLLRNVGRRLVLQVLGTLSSASLGSILIIAMTLTSILSLVGSVLRT